MRVLPITRDLTITAATWATGEWTLTTSGNHYIGIGDTFTFTDQRFPQSVTATTIAGTTGTTIKFTNADASILFPSKISVANYGTGFTGDGTVFTFQFASNTPNGLVHVVSNGTGALASTGVKLQGSLDGTHWKDVGSAIASLTTGAMGEIVVNAPYVYGKLVFSGAITNAGGGANTIKAYRAGC